MKLKEQILTTFLYRGRALSFISSAVKLKRTSVLGRFLLAFCLLFLPVFTLLLKTQPHQMYTRVYSQSFDNATVEIYTFESFTSKKIDTTRPAIYMFGDFVVYADTNIVLSAPSEAFDHNNLQRPFNELFSMIAVYNLYIPNFLLPMLLAVFLVLFVLQLFFVLISAVFLGFARLSSKRFGFGEMLKIVIMSSLLPALPCAVIGFILPGVHIILFQLLNLLIIFYLSKKSDREERELLRTAETTSAAYLPLGE